MSLSPALPVEELLDVCVRNQLITDYQQTEQRIVFVQDHSVYELSPEHAQLYLQNLIRYARGNLQLAPPAHTTDPGMTATLCRHDRGNA